MSIASICSPQNPGKADSLIGSRGAEIRSLAAGSNSKAKEGRISRALRIVFVRRTNGEIKPLRAALWKANTQISLIDPDYGHHGFQTVEENKDGCVQFGLVPALTVNAVASSMGLQAVDLLKIDIEGAEKEVFETSEKWIGKVEVIMAELHDTIKPGCSKSFIEATKDFRQESLKGETVIGFRTEMPS